MRALCFLAASLWELGEHALRMPFSFCGGLFLTGNHTGCEVGGCALVIHLVRSEAMMSHSSPLWLRPEMQAWAPARRFSTTASRW